MTVARYSIAIMASQFVALLVFGGELLGHIFGLWLGKGSYSKHQLGEKLIE